MLRFFFLQTERNIYWNSTPVLLNPSERFVQFHQKAMTAALIMENANWDPGEYFI